MTMPKYCSFAFVSTASYPHVEIWDDLLKNYNKKVNPVRNPGTAVNLSVGITIETIIGLVIMNFMMKKSLGDLD